MKIRLDPDEGLNGRGQWDTPIELTTNTASIDLTMESTPHPDLMALTILMIVRPWVGQRLSLDNAVSPSFAETTLKTIGVEIGPISGDIPQRKPGAHRALAFSGGVDGMAADNMIEGDLSYFHFARRKHPLIPDRATHIRTDANLAMIEQVLATGRSVHIARSDLEFVAARPFPTFAHWVTMAIEPVLRADDEDIGAIVMGRHIAGVYVNSGLYFDPAADMDREWKALFAAAGIDLIVPTAGISEVGTRIVAEEHPYFNIARSCLLGPPGRGCLQCDKCLRKTLIDAYVTEKPVDVKVVDGYQDNPRVVAKFSDPEHLPQRHIFTFLLGRLDRLSETFLGSAYRHLSWDPPATAWVEKYYPPAVTEWIPEMHQTHATEVLSRNLKIMDRTDIAIVESWPAAINGARAY